VKVLFLNVSGLRFVVSTPEKEPLGGSESCVAYLATELASTFQVCLLANTEPGRLRGVLHFNLDFDLNDTRVAAPFFAAQRFDVIIIVNAPFLAPALRRVSPHSRLVLWNHHAPDQPAAQTLAKIEVVRALDYVVYVSLWQSTLTEALYRPPVPSGVIGNGLTRSFESLFANPGELLAAKEARAAYTSTPFRGLEVLLDAYARLSQPIDLDVFSSMQVYRGDDAPFQHLYDQARASSHVHYHGAVSQTRLAAAMRRVSFLSYPCVFAETFCIAALEAMAAGATVVATDLGALPSTTHPFGELLPLEGIPPERLATQYAQFLDASIARALGSRAAWAERMFEQVTVVNRDCTWRKRAADWQALLPELLRRPARQASR
jgi:glycosyltransferase involved in cell wall biosynthesis